MIAAAAFAMVLGLGQASSKPPRDVFTDGPDGNTLRRAMQAAGGATMIRARLQNYRASSTADVIAVPKAGGRVVNAYVEFLGDNAAQRADARTALEGIIKGFEEDAARRKDTADLGAAASFMLLMALGAYEPVNPSDAQLSSMSRQMRAALQPLNKLPERQRRDTYEALLCASGQMLMLSQSGAQARGALREMAAQSTLLILGVPPSRLKLVDTGFQVVR
jgi:hypothetical protein